MTSALVTGGAGFVGAPLVRRLVARKFRVVVLDSFVRGRRESVAGDIEVVEADIRDIATVERTVQEHRPDVVIHLAALHFIPDCDRDPDATMAINAEATGALARIVERSDVERLVFASTAAVYRPSSRAHAEDDALEPVDVYGRSKLAAEQVLDVELAAGRHVIARLFNVFGPGETNPHLIPAIVEQAMSGDTLQLGRTDTVRDYVFVDDVADALASLATASAPRAVVNVGTGRGHTVLDVVAAASEVVGRSLQVEVDESRLRPVDRPHLVADPRVLSATIAWHPVRLVDGLRRIVAAESR